MISMLQLKTHASIHRLNSFFQTVVVLLIGCAAAHAQLFKDVVNIENYAEGPDHPAGYAAEERLFLGASIPSGITEGDIAKLPLDDPKLRIIYRNLVLSGFRILKPTQPELRAALSDLRRRGDAATPLFLDIMAKNHNTDLEHFIPLIINMIGGFKMEPYVKYFREMLQKRPQEINASANETITKLFLDYGTPDDLELMKQLATKRPYLLPSLQRAMEAKGVKPLDAQRSRNVEPKIISQGAPATASLPLSSATTATTERSIPQYRSIWFAAVVASTIGALWWRLRSSKP